MVHQKGQSPSLEILKAQLERSLGTWAARGDLQGIPAQVPLTLTRLMGVLGAGVEEAALQVLCGLVNTPRLCVQWVLGAETLVSRASAGASRASSKFKREKGVFVPKTTVVTPK